MAAKIISDNKLDFDLAQYKKDLETLNRIANAFMVSFHNLPPKERARQLLEIQTKIKVIQKFISTPQQHELTNAGTRFALETLRSNFNTFWGRWIKFEKSLG